MKSFTEYAQSRDAELQEGWMDNIKGAAQAGWGALKGGLNAVGNTAGGALGVGGGSGLAGGLVSGARSVMGGAQQGWLTSQGPATKLKDAVSALNGLAKALGSPSAGQDGAALASAIQQDLQKIQGYGGKVNQIQQAMSQAISNKNTQGPGQVQPPPLPGTVPVGSGGGVQAPVTQPVTPTGTT